MCGPPGEIRTPDTQVRSLVLYPAELRAEARSLGLRFIKVKTKICRQCSVFTHSTVVCLNSGHRHSVASPVKVERHCNSLV